jgi:hypothetical protein
MNLSISPYALLHFDLETTIIYAFFISPLLATCSSHHVTFDFISPIILVYGEEYEL